jgi:DNA polymerase-3 subunit delta'
MIRPTRFADLLGNPAVVGIIRRAIGRGRLPHALIFAGPAGVGKRTLAELVARRLNCLDPRGDEPCGACGSCRKMATGNHPDFRVITPDGATIRIDQVRALIGEIAFEPFEGRFRVAVLDPAEAMRPEAHNSLLKTLEEPASRTYLILVTTSPYALLGTIRSRCRMLQFGAIPEAAIERALIAHERRRPDEARLAARSSNGSLAAALAFDAAGHREARALALEFAALLIGRGSFAEASRLAAGAGTETEKFEPWLESVAAALRDVYYAKMAPERVEEAEESGVGRLAGASTLEAVVAAIEGIAGLRRALANNVNRQLALEALVVERWRGEPSRG